MNIEFIQHTGIASVVLSGVPQSLGIGWVLLPIFINDLRENIRSSVTLFSSD